MKNTFLRSFAMIALASVICIPLLAGDSSDKSRKIFAIETPNGLMHDSIGLRLTNQNGNYELWASWRHGTDLHFICELENNEIPAALEAIRITKEYKSLYLIMQKGVETVSSSPAGDFWIVKVDKNQNCIFNIDSGTTYIKSKN